MDTLDKEDETPALPSVLVDADGNELYTAESGKSYKYRDFSSVGERNNGQSAGVDASAPTRSTSVRVQKFPVKLYAILAQKEFNGIISWMPHGRSWKVLEPNVFETMVMPLFFEYSNYHSFNRLVNAWSFRRVSSGPDRGSYYHELFLRGKPHLQKYMRRLPKTHKKLPMKKSDEPDFYRLDKTNPLPSIDDAPIPGFTAASNVVNNNNSNITNNMMATKQVGGSGMLDLAQASNNRVPAMQGQQMCTSGVLYGQSGLEGGFLMGNGNWFDGIGETLSSQQGNILRGAVGSGNCGMLPDQQVSQEQLGTCDAMSYGMVPGPGPAAVGAFQPPVASNPPSSQRFQTGGLGLFDTGLGMTGTANGGDSDLFGAQGHMSGMMMNRMNQMNRFGSTMDVACMGPRMGQIGMTNGMQETPNQNVSTMRIGNGFPSTSIGDIHQGSLVQQSPLMYGDNTCFMGNMNGPAIVADDYGAATSGGGPGANCAFGGPNLMLGTMGGQYRICTEETG